MKESATDTEVARNFPDYLNRVSRGEHFILTRDGRAIAELRPVPAGMRLGELPAMLASLPRLGEEDAAAFGRDIDAARDELAAAPDHDPWET